MKKNQLLYKQKKYSNSVIKNNSSKIKENNISIEAKGKKSNSHNKKNIKIADNIEHTYELIKSKRGGINLIQDGKYILHKFRPLDSGYSEFRCKKYKDPDKNYSRWDAFCDYNIYEDSVRTDSGKHHYS